MSETRPVAGGGSGLAIGALSSLGLALKFARSAAELGALGKHPRSMHLVVGLAVSRVTR